ncbi:MAG: hypothetical protein V2I32_03540, partial [Desulforhopalus sp.]|nr:hypothetical protein [Desulforhopalus sp.]
NHSLIGHNLVWLQSCLALVPAIGLSSCRGVRHTHHFRALRSIAGWCAVRTLQRLQSDELAEAPQLEIRPGWLGKAVFT